jgi:hypothetical protein
MTHEKTIWPIDRLHNWEQNPRSITKDDFARLKKHIAQSGQFKPLIVTIDGTVLGGNMRLRAFQDLGITEVWVSVVEAPDAKTKLEYALLDNDRAGSYDEQALAELVTNTPEIALGDYKVDLGEPVDLSQLLAKFAPSVADTPPTDGPRTPDVTCPQCGHTFPIRTPY